jgi:hypothetical protein
MFGFLDCFHDLSTLLSPFGVLQEFPLFGQ